MAGCFQTRLILVPLLPTGHFSIYIFKMHRSTFLNYTKPTDRWILRVWNGEMFGQLYASSSLLCLSSFALPKEGGVWHIAALSNLNVPILSPLLRLWLFTFVQVTTYRAYMLLFVHCPRKTCLPKTKADISPGDPKAATNTIKHSHLTMKNRETALLLYHTINIRLFMISETHWASVLRRFPFQFWKNITPLPPVRHFRHFCRLFETFFSFANANVSFEVVCSLSILIAFEI